MHDDSGPQGLGRPSPAPRRASVMDGLTVVTRHRRNRLPAVLLVGALMSLCACGAPGPEVDATPAPSAAAVASPPSATAIASSAPPTPSPTPSTPLKKSRDMYWGSLKPGMCVFEPDEDESVDVTVTDCRAEHHGEVTLRTTLPGDRTWPGDAAVDALAAVVCEKAFAKYVGVAFDESRLDVYHYTTQRDGWEDGDRRLICLVYDPEEETTSVALRGSKQ